MWPGQLKKGFLTIIELNLGLHSHGELVTAILDGPTARAKVRSWDRSLQFCGPMPGSPPMRWLAQEERRGLSQAWLIPVAALGTKGLPKGQTRLRNTFWGCVCSSLTPNQTKTPLLITEHFSVCEFYFLAVLNWNPGPIAYVYYPCPRFGEENQRCLLLLHEDLRSL